MPICGSVRSLYIRFAKEKIINEITIVLEESEFVKYIYTGSIV